MSGQVAHIAEGVPGRFTLWVLGVLATLVAALSPETRAMLTRLQAALAAPIVESGDEAHMPYGPELEVVFVREDGVWRIEDPD